MMRSPCYGVRRSPRLEVSGKTTMSWPKSLLEITAECGDGTEGHRELHPLGGAAGN